MTEGLTAALEHIVEGIVRKVVREEVGTALANLNLRASGADYLTIEEAAAVAKAHHQTVREWVKSGALKASRPNRHYLIRRSDLDAFIATPRESASDDNVTVDAEYERLLSAIHEKTNPLAKRRKRAEPSVSKK
jgi:excisionase family DNA binding protein